MNDWLGNGMNQTQSPKFRGLEISLDEDCQAFIKSFQGQVLMENSIYSDMGGEALLSTLMRLYNNRHKIDEVFKDAFSSGQDSLHLFRAVDNDGVKGFTPDNFLGLCFSNDMKTQPSFPELLALRHWLAFRYKGAIITQWLEPEHMDKISTWWVPRK